MKKATQIFLLLLLCIGGNAFAQSEGDFNKTNTVSVRRIKDQIKAMIRDSEIEFFHNQSKKDPNGAKLIFEVPEDKIQYYEPATKFNGEVSLVRVEERNKVTYKSLLYGWVINSSTPFTVREEVANVRRAAKELIQEKVRSGKFQSFNVKSTDSSSRTELRDKEGRRIMEIADHKTYFHLIIFDNKWRTDPVDGLLSDFTIYQVIESRKKYSLK